MTSCYISSEENVIPAEARRAIDAIYAMGTAYGALSNATFEMAHIAHLRPALRDAFHAYEELLRQLVALNRTTTPLLEQVALNK